MSKVITLANFTTLGIGGKALVDVVYSACELSKCSNSIVLGMGSNVLISDKGVSGRVIINRANAFKIENSVLYAESGCSISHLSKHCSGLGFSGLEWAYMLPATVGGAIVMNAGAFGGQVCDSLLKVGVLRRGKVEEIEAKDCGFSYRTSGFLSEDIILYAYFTLNRADSKLCNKRLEEIKAKRNSQPKGKSAGCIYKTEDKSAGWYIERAGLKNKRIGDIYVSPVHAGFFINAGRGSAKDMLKLMDYVEKSVEDKFNKRLIREIKLIGEF